MKYGILLENGDHLAAEWFDEYPAVFKEARALVDAGQRIMLVRLLTTPKPTSPRYLKSRERGRIVIGLREQGLTFPVIAGILGVSKGRANNIWHDAINRKRWEEMREQNSRDHAVQK